jgi:hypothetical protein
MLRLNLRDVFEQILKDFTMSVSMWAVLNSIVEDVRQLG